MAATALADAGALIVGVLARLARRRTSRRESTVRRRRASRPRGPASAELGVRADRALVETDDALRTSDQELAFAVARFGDRPAAALTAAVRAARTELAAAFRLRQQLLDDVPAADGTRRSVLAEIVGRCAEANRLLDEQAPAFDRLHDRQTGAPRVLAEVDHHVGQQDARVVRFEQILDQLAAKYTAAAVATVADSTGQARARLAFARSALASARQLLQARRGAEAAVLLQAAESSADQAESLLDGVGHRDAELTQASSALPTALREISADIAESAALLAGRPGDTSAAVTRARLAVDAVRDQVATGRPFDALAALRLLTEAASALDHALASTRTERDRRDRAGAVLDQAMLVARSSITTAEDYVTTRRGGVGAEARTRLAEAHRHFEQAIAVAPPNPEEALAQARHADALGQHARSLAELDVARFSSGRTGPWAPDAAAGARIAAARGLHVGAAILGGILIEAEPGEAAESDGHDVGPAETSNHRAGRGGGRSLGTSAARRAWGPDHGHVTGDEGFWPGLRRFGTPGSFGGIGTRARRSIVSTLRAALAPHAYQQGGFMSQQGIVGRVMQLARANVNAVIDSAEDPQVTLDNLVFDYRAHIAGAEQAITQTVANLRMIEQDLKEDTRAAQQWGKKAQAASKRADGLRAAGHTKDADRFDDLARVALERQLTMENDVATIRHTIDAQNESLAKLKSGLDQMKAKLSDLRRKGGGQAARSRTAETGSRAGQAASRRIDILDPASEVGRFEEKVQREEARLGRRGKLAASSLDEQFERLADPANGAEIDRRLKTMKGARDSAARESAFRDSAARRPAARRPARTGRVRTGVH